MMYRKLKRVWTHNDLNYIPNFKKMFPELKSVDSEELANRFIELGIDFYTEEQRSVGILLRLSMPFALILMVIMFLLLPINFLITGIWGYSLGKKNVLYNWFRAVKLQ